MWSNDVNLANKMESSGRPGMVHISEKTHAFIKDEYFVEDGDPIQGRTTGTRKEIALLTLFITLSYYPCAQPVARQSLQE